jgi:hypothetical protein
MTEPTSAVELRLRETLLQLRPPDAAPDALRARVAAVPEARPRAWWRPAARALAAALAVAGVAAAVIGLVALRPAFGPIEPAGPGANPPMPFDPMIEGPGILRSVASTLVVVPLVVATAIAVIGLRWALRERWHVLAIRLAIVAALAGGIGSLALHPGFVVGSAYGPMIGYGLQVDPPPGSNYPPVWYETAEPGGPLVLVVTVRNPGPLPIQLDGLVETQTSATPLIQRWTALWLTSDPNTIGGIDHAVPFTPTVVEPQGELQVFLVGRSGLCAYGPGYTLASPVSGHITRDRELDFAFSVLGLQSSAPFELPVSLVEPYRDNCTAG